MSQSKNSSSQAATDFLQELLFANAKPPDPTTKPPAMSTRIQTPIISHLKNTAFATTLISLLNSANIPTSIFPTDSNGNPIIDMNTLSTLLNVSQPIVEKQSLPEPRYTRHTPFLTFH